LNWTLASILLRIHRAIWQQIRKGAVKRCDNHLFILAT
jgi:hypothetical protein